MLYWTVATAIMFTIASLLIVIAYHEDEIKLRLDIRKQKRLNKQIEKQARKDAVYNNKMAALRTQLEELQQ